MDSFVFSKTLPNNSIVNPAVDPRDYLDNNSPFSFIDFLKYTKADLSPVQFNDLYVGYIKQWNTTKSLNKNDINDSIKNRYIELIKEITIKYTTAEEKRFLANVDYDDPLDLDVIIPFYSKKIREVCSFYADKREKIKYKIEKNKIKGTPTSVERSVFETITDVLFSDTLEVGTYQKLVNSKVLSKKLDIEIEELYDLYTNYLDNDPQESFITYDIKNDLRKSLYTSNLNAIDANIFINIDKAVQGQIFESVIVFLEEFGKLFAVDYDINAVNLNCKTGDPLADLVLSTKDKATREVQLRNKLITKYIGSDFYYISTGDDASSATVEKLFTASNPTGNLLNRNFPTTASIEESELESIRRIGLFFTPDKSGILYFSVPEKKYKIDYSKLEPNKLYVFPDPERYGNAAGLSRKYNSEYPLIHIQEYTKSVKGPNYFEAEGDIDSNQHTQDFHAYFSKGQASNSAFGNEGLNLNLGKLSNIGHLTKWCTDIYGNQYGLFKSKSRNKLVDNRIQNNSTRNVLVELDGGPATFYSGELLPETVPSSHKSWVYPNVWSSDYYYNMLVECGIGGFYKGIMRRGEYEQIVYDGRGVINKNTVVFRYDFNPVTYYSYDIIDGLTYQNTSESNFQYNINKTNSSLTDPYSYIIDGNIYDIVVSSTFNEVKTLDGNPLVNTSDYAPDGTYEYVLSSIQYEVYDGGGAFETIDEVYDFREKENFVVTQVVDGSKSVLSTTDTDDSKNSNDLRDSFGTIYVKNVVSGSVGTLLTQLGLQFDKYPSNVKNEIYNFVLDFGVFNDVIWIRTRKYLILDRISFEVDSFVYSGTSNNYIEYTQDGKIDVSNPFFFENRDYGMLTTLELSAYESNSFYIIPSIYKFEYKNTNISKIYPEVIDSSFRNVSGSNPVKICRINTQSFAYNSRNEKYSIITTVEDQNEYPYVYNFTFDYNGSEVTPDRIRLYTITSGSLVETCNTTDSNIISSGKIIYNNTLSATSTITQNYGSLVIT